MEYSLDDLQAVLKRGWKALRDFTNEHLKEAGHPEVDGFRVDKRMCAASPWNYHESRVWYACKRIMRFYRLGDFIDRSPDEIGIEWHHLPHEEVLPFLKKLCLSHAAHDAWSSAARDFGMRVWSPDDSESGGLITKPGPLADIERDIFRQLAEACDSPYKACKSFWSIVAMLLESESYMPALGAIAARATAGDHVDEDELNPFLEWGQALAGGRYAMSAPGSWTHEDRDCARALLAMPAKAIAASLAPIRLAISGTQIAGLCFGTTRDTLSRWKKTPTPNWLVRLEHPARGEWIFYLRRDICPAKYLDAPQYLPADAPPNLRNARLN
jgi:hypothetical protein